MDDHNFTQNPDSQIRVRTCVDSDGAVESQPWHADEPVATVLPVKGYMGGGVGATQTVWFFQRALQSTSSLRMQAVRATSLGLPAATRRRCRD